jgi:hypothetical protein
MSSLLTEDVDVFLLEQVLRDFVISHDTWRASTVLRGGGHIDLVNLERIVFLRWPDARSEPQVIHPSDRDGL